MTDRTSGMVTAEEMTRYEELVSASLDGELNEEEAAELAATENAHPEWAQIKEKYGMLSDAIRESAPALPEGFKKTVLRRVSPRRPRFVRIGVIAASAAVCVLVVGTVFMSRYVWAGANAKDRNAESISGYSKADGLEDSIRLDDADNKYVVTPSADEEEIGKEKTTDEMREQEAKDPVFDPETIEFVLSCRGITEEEFAALLDETMPKPVTTDGGYYFRAEDASALEEALRRKGVDCQILYGDAPLIRIEFTD